MKESKQIKTSDRTLTNFKSYITKQTISTPHSHFLITEDDVGNGKTAT